MFEKIKSSSEKKDLKSFFFFELSNSPKMYSNWTQVAPESSFEGIQGLWQSQK